ncbi:MAG: ABC transporter ATP-binding protein [Chloroflexi bacterium]|nr:ABC transporter ATP-binding protein [Chloroflexota bacterium]
MTSHAIELRGVTRRFGATTAVDDLSLTVDAGEVFGFLGHNGAGKTTTVRLLNGVLTADSGEIRVMGLDPRVQGPELRARTGVLTETPSLDERLNAVDNLTYYADLYGVPVDRVPGRVQTMLEAFGLADRAREKVGGYSKGMKQRLALGRAFLHEPEMIFLDEPTAGLDPVAAQELHQMIRHASREEGRTVFLCTHNLVEAQRLCDRVAVMEHGHLVAAGTPHQLARETGADLRYTLEVAPGQQEAACRAAAAHPSVKGAQVAESNGAAVILSVTDREAVSDILVALLAAGIRLYALTPHDTSLEDIYLALHQGSGRPS